METNAQSQAPSVSGETTQARSGAVETLLNDHVQIKALLDQLTQAQPAERIGCIEALKSILVLHNATEENLIYPALHAVAGENIEPRKLYWETAEADMLLFALDQLAKGLTEGDFAGKARKFATAVREHIESEEQSAFPHLRQKVEAGDLAHLDRAVAEFRGKLRFGAAGGGGIQTRTGTM